MQSLLKLKTGGRGGSEQALSAKRGSFLVFRRTPKINKKDCNNTEQYPHDNSFRNTKKHPLDLRRPRKQNQKMKNRQQTRRLLLRNLGESNFMYNISDWWFFCKHGFNESLRLGSIYDFGTRNSPSPPKSVNGCRLIPLSSAIIRIIYYEQRPDWADSGKRK